MGISNNETFTFPYNKDTVVAFTGHRPEDLGTTYSMSDKKTVEISRELEKLIEDLIINRGIRVFISGGALGFDTIAFFSVEKVKRKLKGQYDIKNILAVPFKDQPAAWKQKSCSTCNCFNCLNPVCLKNQSCSFAKCSSCRMKSVNYWYTKTLKLADAVYYVDTIPKYQLDKKTPVEKFSSFKLNIRNFFMVDQSSIMIAGWNESKNKGGTYNCLAYAERKNCEYYHLDPTGEIKFNYKKRILK